MSETIGPLPGQDNVGVVIECGRCQGQTFKVAFFKAPLAHPQAQPGQFTPMVAGGRRLTPRYALTCAGCGEFLLAPPEGPDPLTVRGDVNRN